MRPILLTLAIVAGLSQLGPLLDAIGEPWKALVVTLIAVALVLLSWCGILWAVDRALEAAEALDEPEDFEL